ALQCDVVAEALVLGNPFGRRGDAVPVEDVDGGGVRRVGIVVAHGVLPCRCSVSSCSSTNQRPAIFRPPSFGAIRMVWRSDSSNRAAACLIGTVGTSFCGTGCTVTAC